MELDNLLLLDTDRTARTRVLLFVTLKRRDLFPMKKIARELMKVDGFSVRLAGISDFPYAVMAYKPHIVLFGKPDNAWGDWLRCMSNCTVVSLNTEQGGHSQQEVTGQFIDGHAGTRGPALDLVDHHLIVDEQTKQYLSQMIDPARMHVVGYPRLLADKLALEARPVKGPMVIGFACGADVIDKSYLMKTFNLYQEKQFGPWNNIQMAHTNDILELIWINYLTEMLKTQFRVLVRYRHGDDAFLLDQSSVELDRSDSLEYLFNEVDLMVVGRSTVGVEALTVGIPAITVAGLVRPDETFVGAKEFWTAQYLWQPTSLDQFAKMVELRATNDLELGPNTSEYERFVRATYFCGGSSDRSIERIVDLLTTCEPGKGAVMDMDRMRSLIQPSWRERILGGIAQRISRNLAYQLAMAYLRLRRRFRPDAYMRHGVYIPERLRTEV